MKKIIITGGLGFIGSHLVKLFLNSGYQVLNIDKISYASIKNINFKSKNYFFKKIDISNFSKLYKAVKTFDPEYIINCAAESHVDRSIVGPKVFIESNIVGTFNVLETINKLNRKIRLLQVSTDEVYGSLKIKEKKFTEKSKYDPKSPYSASKASSDHLVRAYGNTYNLDYIITNCSNNFGPFQNPEKFIPTVILSCLKKNRIPVYGNGKNIREWIFVEDHCRGIKLSLEKGKKSSTYLIGSKNEFNNIEIVRKICNLFKSKDNFNYEKLIDYVDDRKGHDFRYAINYSKISKQLNFSNKVSFNLGLKKTIDFYVKNIKKINNIFRI